MGRQDLQVDECTVQLDCPHPGSTARTLTVLDCGQNIDFKYILLYMYATCTVSDTSGSSTY
jgi:hypothetical protein